MKRKTVTFVGVIDLKGKSLCDGIIVSCLSLCRPPSNHIMVVVNIDIDIDIV